MEFRPLLVESMPEYLPRVARCWPDLGDFVPPAARIGNGIRKLSGQKLMAAGDHRSHFLWRQHGQEINP